MEKNTKLLLIGVGFTALATFAAFKILEFDRETINFTDQRVRLIVNSEVPIGSSRTRVNQFLDGKGWIHSDMGSKTQVMIRDASHRGLIRTDIRIRFLFDSEEKLVSYEIHDILTGP